MRRGAAAGSSLFRAPFPPSSREAPSIAVLPFVNRSRDEKDEYFSDGLADELLSVLSKIRGLRVAARTSSATFKGKQVTVGEVGRALNVATVLEGSVRKSGNRVRIAVHLVKVADGYHLWSETYDRTLDDIFAVQDDIAQSVVKELRTTLMGTDANSRASGEARAAVAAAAKGRAGNVEAHRLYLQGKYFVDRLTQQDTARGIEHLKRALEIDPGNASAWTCLGRAYSRQISWAWAPVFEGHQRARDAVERALSLAPDLAEAHVLLCHLQTMIEWDWKGAEASSRRALELAPGSAEVLREASVLATLHGRLEEAADLMRRSIAQDPLSSTGYSQLGYIYRSLGRPADALREYRKALELAPQRAAAHHMIAIILAEQGRLDEALAEAEAEPEEWTRLTALAIIHHLAGRQAESDEALRLLEVRCSGDSAFQIGAVHASRGEADAAFAWLDRAFAQRDTGLTQLQCEPALRPIQADPRWRALLEKLGFEI
jgi:TolB-like protein/Tfp pilus assembly protein PilF